MPTGLEPLLARVPDARRSRWPLFPAAFFPYAALMIGAAPAAACALWNAAGVRRWRPALAALLLGASGWVGVGIVAGLVLRSGVRNVALAVIVARLFGLGCGLLLARSQWAYVRGHSFLGGRAVPLLGAVLAALVLALAVPMHALLALWGIWEVLLS
jgi:hypothetical protein